MGSLNVMKHAMVPVHRLVPENEEEKILRGLGTSKNKLPKILKSDPAVIQLIDISGDIKEGRMIEVERESTTAGLSKAYRLVVKR